MSTKTHFSLLLILVLAGCTAVSEPSTEIMTAVPSRTLTPLIEATAVPATTTPTPLPVTAVATTDIPPTESIPLPSATQTAIPSSAVVVGWLKYDNDFLGYQFSYPPEATIGTQGVTGFPTDELPQGMSAEAYRQQLETVYPDNLCVGVRTGLGFVTFVPSSAEEGRYTVPCGVTGVGDYDLLELTEVVQIEGFPHTAKGWQAYERSEEALWQSEFYYITFADGSQIHYGSFGGTQAQFEETKAVLLQIVTSFRSEVAQLPTPAPTMMPVLPTAVPVQNLNWIPYQSDSFSLQYPASWEISEQEGFVYFLSNGSYGEGPQPVKYVIYAVEYLNPEDRPFPQVVRTLLSPELQPTFNFIQETIGPYTVYRTAYMPSAEGGLTVFFEGDGRYLSLALVPYNAQNPFPGQAQYEQLFAQLLQTVQLTAVSP